MTARAKKDKSDIPMTARLATLAKAIQGAMSDDPAALGWARDLEGMAKELYMMSRPHGAGSGDSPLSAAERETAFEPELMVLRHQVKCLAVSVDWLTHHRGPRLIERLKEQRRRAILESIGLVSRAEVLLHDAPGGSGE